MSFTFNLAFHIAVFVRDFVIFILSLYFYLNSLYSNIVWCLCIIISKLYNKSFSRIYTYEEQLCLLMLLKIKELIMVIIFLWEKKKQPTSYFSQVILTFLKKSCKGNLTWLPFFLQIIIETIGLFSILKVIWHFKQKPKSAKLRTCWSCKAECGIFYCDWTLKRQFMVLLITILAPAIRSA